MPRNANLYHFSKNTRNNINLFRTSAVNDSRTSEANCKLTQTQKEVIRDLCREHNVAVSRFIYDALSLYIDIFPYREKFVQHRRWLREGLSILT